MKLTGKSSGSGLGSMKKAGSLLESDYISKLNKEKDDINASIAINAKNKPVNMDDINYWKDLQNSETKKERK